MSKQVLHLLSCVFLLCVTANVSNADLIAYWPFDEGAGDVAADVIGGNDAQITDAAWTSASQMGSAAIDVAPGNQINCGPGPAPTTEDLTLAWWMIDNHESYGTMLSKSGESSTKGYNILVRTHSGEGSPLRFRIGGWQAYGGWGDECMIPEGAYEDGTWVHITCTYDSASDTATIYVNGEVAENGDLNPKTGIAGDGGYCEGLNNPDEPLYIVGNPETFTGIIDEVAIWDHALTPGEIQSVLTLGPLMLDPGAANAPTPEDGAGDIARDLVLTWTPGENAVTRNAFLGTSAEDVSNASIADPLGTTVGQDLMGGEWNPGRLEFGQTYFWRVDEVNGAPDRTVFTGTVWSFTVEPLAYAIENVTVSASSQQDETMGPENTINGVGLNELDQHSTVPTEMWLSGGGDATPSIQYEFDRAYTLHEMWVWNSNQVIEAFVGVGAKEVTVEYSLDGTEWQTLENAPEFAQATGSPDYTANTAVDFGGAQAKFVKLIINSGYGLLPQHGLSAVRFLYIPTQAREPQPADGSTTDTADIVLSWRSGREAASSEVYLGTDAADLALLGTTTDNSLAVPDVDYGATYFWSVTEVNEAEAVSSYAGDVWSFKVPDTGIVDDFELYDDNCNRIFFTWADGLGHNGGDDIEGCDVPAYNGNGTGSIVGNAMAPFAEKSIVLSGRQSLPLAYEGNSETTADIADLPIGSDWTKGSPTTLVVWVRGDAANAAADQLYVKLNNSKVTYAGDLSVPIWKQWNIDLAASGANLSSINTLAIGVEASGPGMLYLDGIALYGEAPAVVEPPAGGDPSLVAHWKLDEAEGLTASDSSGCGNHGTLIGMTGTEWTSGTQDGALALAGVAGSPQYVDFGNATSLQLTGEATISAWVKMEPGNADAYMGIAGKLGDTTGANRGYVLVRHSSNVFRLWLVSDGNFSGADSDVTYNDSDWHHLVGVISDNTGVLYVDGVRQAITAEGPLQDSGDIAFISRQYDDFDDRYWNGAVDDVRIYYRALSEQEIAGL